MIYYYYYLYSQLIPSIIVRNNTHLPFPETSSEFKNLSSPALKYASIVPVSMSIKFTCIRLLANATNFVGLCRPK